MRRVWSGKAAWRRRQGMAVRPHPPSAAAKQSASRARKQQAAQALAARECAAIQQALRTRAEQSWELAELIDACSRDPDMPHQVPEGCPSVSWQARVPTVTVWPPRACAGIGGRSSAWHTSGPPGKHTGPRERRGTRQSQGGCAPPPTQGPHRDHVSGTWLDDQHLCEKPLAQKKSFAITIRSDAHACTLTLPMYPVAGKVCVTMRVSPCPHALQAGAFLYTALERAHLFTAQGRARPGGGGARLPAGALSRRLPYGSVASCVLPRHGDPGSRRVDRPEQHSGGAVEPGRADSAA